ncbi:MAG: cysteine hydrolase family protein [Gemmatimonadales bacterium]
MPETNEAVALLVMDVQPATIDRAPDTDAYLAKVQQAIDHAHRKHMPVIHVVVSFRKGAPEAVGIFREMGAKLAEQHPVIAVAANDFVVVKRRVSAFTGSDLEVLLRAQNIRHLVLAGIATSGVVLSTLRESYDKDFQATVLSDLCIDPDPEVHAVLINKVFPRQAAVMTCAEWIAVS